MTRTALILTVALSSALATEAAAQRLTREDQSTTSKAALSISGKVGKKSIQASGSGSCRHAPDASIHGVSASLWMVQYGGSENADLNQLNLTLWRPKDGAPDQLSVAMETRSGEHRIETGPRESKGEGSVTILPNGPGGRLELKGKDSSGKPVQITIDCPVFGGVEAEGG